MHPNILLPILLSLIFPFSLADFPTNLTFTELTTTYLPFLSINLAFIANDTRTTNQLANVGPHCPVTIFISLDLPFQEFFATPPPSPEIGAVEAAHYNDPASNAQVLQFLQLDGVHGLTSLVGTVFATTRLAAGPGVEVSGGAKIKIVRTAEVFTVESGVGRVANVVIPNIPFASGNGLIHIIDAPAAPPYSLPDTGIVLNNTFINTLISLNATYPTDLSNATDVTIFAVQNSAFDDIADSYTWPQFEQYLLIGDVLYSTDLQQTPVLEMLSGGTLNVTTDEAGDVFVQGVKVVMPDVLIENGVVHVLESPVTTH